MYKHAVFTYVILGALQGVLSLPKPGSYYTDEAARRLLHYDVHTGDCVLFGDR